MLKSLPSGIPSSFSLSLPSPPSRGQNQLLLEKMGRSRSRSLGPQCGQDRILHQVLAPSSAIHDSNCATRFLEPCQGCTVGSGVSKCVEKGSHRNPGGQDLSGILLKTFPGPQTKQQMETSDRPQPSERLCPDSKIQDGHPSKGHVINKERPLGVCSLHRASKSS